MNNTTGAAELPEALKHAEGLESFAGQLPAYGFNPQPLKDAAAHMRRLYKENEALRAKQPAPECLTCSGHGAVGNILTAEPCPDCTPPAHSAPAAQPAGAATPAAPGVRIRALDAYNIDTRDADPGSPIERLRFFCALTMSGQDWRDAEQFFADIEAAPQPAVTAGAVDALTQAARDVLAERQRQISAEGWTPEHDDEHDTGQMAAAASCYALLAEAGPHLASQRARPAHWPWSLKWWKPGGTRRMLVKAGALILAEIERLDRAALAAQRGGAA